MVIFMKMKTFTSAIICILIGILLSKYIFNQYDNLKALSINSIYFLKLNSYNSKEDMEKDVMKLKQYIIEEDDGMYHVYLGITSELDNFNKLESYFEENNYKVTLKEKQNVDNDFIKILEKYDVLLKNTNDNSVISIINEQVISKYKEMITNG